MLVRMSPLEALLGWFDSLAVELRQDVAFLVFSSLPDELFAAEPEGDNDTMSSKYAYAKFGERLERWGGRKISRQAGIAAAVAGILDVVISNRGNRADWDETQALMENALNDPELAEVAQSSLDQLPLRERRWIRAATAWKELRVGALSVATINEWIREQLLRTAGRG